MFIDSIIYSLSYTQLFLLTTAYFLLLYFGLAPVFNYACKVLHKNGVLQKIAPGEVTREQTVFEISHSVRSILIFGLSGIPVIYLVRIGVVKLLPDTFLNIVVGLLILNIWNEVHFFVVHRIMHIQFFMKRVHYIHHRSVVPTVYSVYSFHWLEALLLSTVPLTIVPFVPFSPWAVALYPLSSILINYSGHCNYRFGSGAGPSWQTLGTRHAEHHYKRSRHYGFATSFMDWLTRSK